MKSLKSLFNRVPQRNTPKRKIALRLAAFSLAVGFGVYRINRISQSYSLSSTINAQVPKKYIINQKDILEQMQRMFDKEMQFSIVNIGKQQQQQQAKEEKTNDENDCQING